MLYGCLYQYILSSYSSLWNSLPDKYIPKIYDLNVLKVTSTTKLFFAIK